MTFNFTVKEFLLGNSTGTPTLQFYRRGFNLQGNGGGDWRDIILHGNTALTLVNAKANSLEYLKLFGGTEQRNLPSGYTQVNYVTNTAQTMLDTGVKFDFSKNYEIELRVRGVVGSWYIFQAKDTGGDVWGFSGSQKGLTIRLGFGADSATSQITRVDGNIYYIKGTINNGNLTLYVKDETAGTEDTATGTYTVTTGQSVNICLFGNLASQYVGINSDVYFARIKEEGNYILNYVPCKQSTTVGFFDKASNTFKTTTNLSAGADVTVPSPDTPMDIVSNNGVVKVSPNLLDMANANIHAGFINSTVGQPVNWQTSSVTNTIVDAVNIKVGETYTFSSFNNINGALLLYVVDNNVLRQKEQYLITENQRTSGSITATANGQLYIQYVIAGQDFQLEKGSTATPYMPYGIYTDGTTETVEITGKNLFDSTSIITGCRLSNLLNNTYGASDFAADTSYYVSNLIPVEIGKTYIKNSPSADAYHRFKIYNANKVSVRISSENSITIQSGEAYIAFCGLQTELATAYCGEHLGSATAENLFKVGTYQDVQDVASGNVTRNVGVKVLDGTEDFVLTGSIFTTGITGRVTTKSAVICSHFLYSSKTSTQVEDERIITFQSLNVGFRYDACANITAFKQWLKDQYNAGTPVIVLYPLATATTETVTAQAINIQAGTNIVEITQGSIDELELEVKYKAPV